MGDISRQHFVKIELFHLDSNIAVLDSAELEYVIYKPQKEFGRILDNLKLSLVSRSSIFSIS